MRCLQASHARAKPGQALLLPCIALGPITNGIHTQKSHYQRNHGFIAQQALRSCVVKESSWVECFPKPVWVSVVVVGSSCSRAHPGVHPYGVVGSTKLSSRASGNSRRDRRESVSAARHRWCSQVVPVPVARVHASKSSARQPAAYACSASRCLKQAPTWCVPAHPARTKCGAAFLKNPIKRPTPKGA